MSFLKIYILVRMSIFIFGDHYDAVDLDNFSTATCSAPCFYNLIKFSFCVTGTTLLIFNAYLDIKVENAVSCVFLLVKY